MCTILYTIIVYGLSASVLAIIILYHIQLCIELVLMAKAKGRFAVRNSYFCSTILLILLSQFEEFSCVKIFLSLIVDACAMHLQSPATHSVQ